MLKLEKNYASLSKEFYSVELPRTWPHAQLVYRNAELCEELGIDDCKDNELEALLSATQFLPDSQAVSMAYAGHQFGNFVPSLGDGRALLLGELRNKEGTLIDVHLKGSGATAFSRGGDGHSPLGPVLRECIVSLGTHHLGILASRPLAALLTGDTVRREKILPGAILARTARSHIRVGTYEYFACRGDTARLTELHNFVCQRLFPTEPNIAEDFLGFFQRVSVSLAETFAKWMAFGFVHGVLNTDNTILSGETLDFGPCAYLDEFNPMAVFSSIDREGRYAYGNQPVILRWNLARLADCLLTFPQNQSETAVSQFEHYLNAELPRIFEKLRHNLFCKKLGLASISSSEIGNCTAKAAAAKTIAHETEETNEETKVNATLIADFLEILNSYKLDYTLAFRALCDESAYNLLCLTHKSPNTDKNTATEENKVADAPAWQNAFTLFQDRLFQQHHNQQDESQRDQNHSHENQRDQNPQRNAVARAQMRAANPVVVPRNHLVEKAILLANSGDFSFFHEFVKRLQSPFERVSDQDVFEMPPMPEEKVTATFCGT